jgi:raffinose/stachyose/melibiose transport system permease protein
MKHDKAIIWIILFLLPTLLLFIAIYGLPLVTVIATAFTDWRLSKPLTFVGLDNFKRLLFQDDNARRAILNTVVWVLIQSTLHVALGTLLAFLAFRRKRIWNALSISYMIPNIISPVVRGMIFLFVFNPQYGLVNSFVRRFINPEFTQNWFFDPSTAFFTVTLGWFLFAAIVMLLIHAQMATISQSILESAMIDGASDFQIKIHIILPLIKPMIGTCIILSATSMLKEFEFIYVTTQGGPGNVTLSLPLYLYKTALLENNYGYANTIGVLLIVFGILIILGINRLFLVNKDAE